MKKIFVAIPVFMLMLYVLPVFAADEISLYNNGGYVTLSSPVIMENDTAFAPAADLIDARDDWKTAYSEEEKVLRAYSRLGAVLRFCDGMADVYRKNIFGEEENVSFSHPVFVRDGVLYVGIRDFYEKLYGYCAEWNDEKQEIFTSMYKNEMPEYIQSDDETVKLTIDDLDIIYVEECLYRDKWEVRAWYSGTLMQSAPGGCCMHFYDRDGKYLQTCYLPMKDHLLGNKFIYYHFFYVPKAAVSVKFSVGMTPPTGEIPVYWQEQLL